MSLKIDSWTDGKVAHLVLAGEIDANSIVAVRKITDELLSSSPDHLILRVDELANLPSATLRNLIFARQKQPSLEIHFVRPMASLVNILKEAGFRESVYVWGSKEEDTIASHASHPVTIGRSADSH